MTKRSSDNFILICNFTKCCSIFYGWVALWEVNALLDLHHPMRDCLIIIKNYYFHVVAYWKTWSSPRKLKSMKFQYYNCTFSKHFFLNLYHEFTVCRTWLLVLFSRYIQPSLPKRLKFLFFLFDVLLYASLPLGICFDQIMTEKMLSSLWPCCFPH